jgi:hypothetical protein
VTRDFESLIKQGYSATDHAQAILENELGIIYRDAYEQAAKELGELYLKLGDKIDLPTARKYRRLETLMKSLSDAYKEVTGKTVALTTSSIAQSFQEAFYSYTWAMEKTLFDGYDLDLPKMISIEASWGVLPVDAIIASIASENSGLSLVSTFKKNMQGNLWRIQSTITRGLANGHSYRKTAKAIEAIFNKGLSDAMRVVRTELGRNFTQGFLEAHDRAVKSGISVKKQWVASADGRTRYDHIVADGQYSDKNGLFRVGGSSGRGPGLMDDLGQNINCRCRLIDVLEGFPPELRRYGEDIGPYVPLKQWAEDNGYMKDGRFKVTK